MSQAKQDIKYLKKLGLFFRKLPGYYPGQLWLLVFLKLISASFLLVAPFLSKLYMDEAFLSENFGKFLVISVFGIGVFILSTVFLALEDLARNRLMMRLKFNFANKLIRKLCSLELAFFRSRSTGESVYRLSNLDVPTDFLVEQYPCFLVDLLKLIVVLVVSFWVNWYMTLALLILAPLFLKQRFYLQSKLRPIYTSLWESTAKLSKKIHESFSRVMVIKALGLEPYQRHGYLKLLVENIRLNIEGFRWSVFYSLNSSFLSKAVYGAVMLLGGWFIIKGKISVGSYTAAMLYLMQVGALMESLSYRFEHIAKESVSIEKFMEVMDSQPGIRNCPGSARIDAVNGAVSFKNVVFGYNAATPVFNGLNMRINPSGWTAIVGPSGCGKTTLINLLLRFYDPWQGQIFLDGRDLKDIRLEDLRMHIALAPQEPLLFDVSLRENIVCGRKNISQGQIDEAVRIACLDGFIKDLPQGYDTLAGEEACILSYGFKQRLSLARAIAGNPGLLVLDEAISSVGALIEERILKALREKRQGAATIIISHRLLAAKDAQRVYFINNGGLVTEGTHIELMSVNPQYREFFSNQGV